jgi:hypothetical protein
MSNAKLIAGLLGPTLMVMIASEFPLVQPHLYDEQIPPVVYLSGLLMFIGGLAILRWHYVWRLDWTLLVTLSGLFLLLLGLFRMFAAGFYQRSSAAASSSFFIVIEGVLFLVGLVLTVQAYRRSGT